MNADGILKNDRLLIAIPLVLFSVITLVGVLHHEVWMDEAHHWLLARDSGSISELWKNTRYEGHPILWNLLLYGITRFTTDPVWMQLFHWMLSVMVATLFLRYSPLPIRFNILFIFGYFTLYEYALISRNYALLLIAFIFCLRYYSTRQYIALGCSLFFLANTHLFGLILAFLLLALVIYNQFGFMPDCASKTGLLISITGFVVSIIQIYPPSDSPFSPDFHVLFSTLSINRFLAIFVRAFLPIPDFFNYHFWNSNLVTSVSMNLAGIMSLLVLTTIIAILSKHLKILIFFLLFTISITLVVTMLYPASVAQATRHFGIIYIVFIGCLWICHYNEEKKIVISLTPRTQHVVITLLLIVQLVAGASSWYYDIKRPFSEAKNVVSYLRINNLAQLPVVTFYGPIPTISCYLEKQTYSLPEAIPESFYSWTKVMDNPIDSESLLSAINFAHNKKTNCILIVYSPLPIYRNIIFLKKFDHAVVNKTLYVYKVIDSTDNVTRDE